MELILCIRWRLGLEVLKSLEENNNIVYVITDTTEIIEYCKEHNLKCTSPLETRWKSVFEIQHDLLVSCMFNKILSREIIEKPRLGSINIHQSILPKHRGRTPLLHAIMDNDQTIGYTVHYMNEYVDQGNILYQESWTINYNDTLDQIMDQYVSYVPRGVGRAISLIKEGYEGIKQNETDATYCTKDIKSYEWNIPIRLLFK